MSTTSDQQSPLSLETQVTGSFGVTLYGVIIIISLLSFFSGIKSDLTKVFFSLLMLMAFLEIPRFLVMAVTGVYYSNIAYCFHIFAGSAYFMAFSVLSYQWSGLLELGTYAKIMYSSYGLITANAIFVTMDIVFFGICASSSRLSSFFRSPSYTAYTLIESVKNLIYSMLITYHGFKLMQHLYNLSRFEKRVHEAESRKSVSTASIYSKDQDALNTKDGLSNQCYRICCCLCCYYCCGFCLPAPEVVPGKERIFSKVFNQLFRVLMVNMFCSSIRIIVLLLKLIAKDRTQIFNNDILTIYGFVWFCLSDFIPRFVPSFCFALLMRTKTPKRKKQPELSQDGGSSLASEKNIDLSGSRSHNQRIVSQQLNNIFSILHRLSEVEKENPTVSRDQQQVTSSVDSTGVIFDPNTFESQNSAGYQIESFDDCLSDEDENFDFALERASTVSITKNNHSSHSRQKSAGKNVHTSQPGADVESVGNENL